MDVTTLVGINEKLGNVHHVRYPHFGLRPVQPRSGPGIALFFGAPFYVIPELDREVYVARLNECLDYIRQHCKGSRLLYKPHPSEKDELDRLNLNGFEIIREKNIADTYLEEHRDEIQYVFSVHSIASITAYSLGLNSYIFLDLFRDAYRETLFRWYREVFFTEMPLAFFISDLSHPPVENKQPFADDRELAEALSGVLSSTKGTIWFILQVSPLDAMLSTLRMVRELFPDRKVGLLLYRHHRWDKMNLDDIRSLFDEVHVFPRTFYSLRLKKLWQVFRLTRSVKKFPIGKDDAFIGFAGNELLENCFVSYYPKNLRIAFWTYRSFLIHQNTATTPFFRKRVYRFTPAALVFNKIILPLLGLHRVVFLKPAGIDEELYTVHRYQRPMNELYDHVFYLHV